MKIHEKWNQFFKFRFKNENSTKSHNSWLQNFLSETKQWAAFIKQDANNLSIVWVILT